MFILWTKVKVIEIKYLIDYYVYAVDFTIEL